MPLQSVFITGNHEDLGNWEPEGLPLTRDGEVWRSSMSVPKNTWLEFKVTDGSWEKEAAISHTMVKKTSAYWLTKTKK